MDGTLSLSTHNASYTQTETKTELGRSGVAYSSRVSIVIDDTDITILNMNVEVDVDVVMMMMMMNMGKQNEERHGPEQTEGPALEPEQRNKTMQPVSRLVG